MGCDRVDMEGKKMVFSQSGLLGNYDLQGSLQFLASEVFPRIQFPGRILETFPRAFLLFPYRPLKPYTSMTEGKFD